MMHGPVTMQIITTGIEAGTFKGAIIEVKNLPIFSQATICRENDLEFIYSIGGQFPCYGRMENNSLKIIREG